MSQTNLAPKNPMEEAPAVDFRADSDSEPRGRLEALWLAARRGDARATDALCRELRPGLYRVAYAWLQDADEADDVAQEALVRALVEKFWFGTPKNIRAWMNKVAQNLARNRARNRGRRAAILRAAEPVALQARGALAPDGKTSLDRVLQQEASYRTEQVLSQLPQRQREVATLRLFGNLSFAEIGAALGIREDNARVVFGKAKTRIESNLRQVHETTEEVSA